MIFLLGYDKSEVERLMAQGDLCKETKSASHSVSSLDQEDTLPDLLKEVCLQV